MTRRNWSIVGGALALIACVAWFTARHTDGLDSSGVARTERLKSGEHGSPQTAHDPRTAASDAADRESSNVARPSAGRRSAAPGFEQRSALYARASSADREALFDMITDARGIADRFERVPTLEILLLRLAEQDLSAAVRLVLEGDRADLLALVSTLAARDPESVWRAVAQIGDPLARMEAQSAVAPVWIAHDPERAFASIRNLPVDWTREQLMQQAASELASRDPLRAIELLQTLPNSERRALYEVAVERWAHTDPTAAAEWIEAQDVQMQGALAFRIAGPYVAQQPEEALAWALRISRSPGRNLWSTMIGQIATYDPEDALRRARAADNPMQRSQALSRAIAAIAMRDPMLATAHLDELPPGNARRNAIAEVARQVAQVRPSGAVDWLRDLPDASMRMEAAYVVAMQVAQHDADAAAQMIDRVPKEVRTPWIESVAIAYTQSDPEQGMQWLSKWRDEAPHVVNNFVHNLAMRDVDASLVAIERLSDGAERDAMMANVMSMVAMQAPETAIEHFQDMQDDRMRVQAAASIAGAWSQQDPAGARKWTTSLAAGPIRDAALSQVIRHADATDERIALLEQIQSPDRRMAAVMDAAAHLSRTDPDGMRALLRRFPLDPQRQQQLEAMTKSGGRFRSAGIGY